MSNIKIVAKLAGCSIATVSRCFNSPDLVRPVTRARIMEIAKQQKFRPSIIGRQLRRNQTGMVGVMLPTEIGRATGRERVCQYVSIQVVAVALKQKSKISIQHT